MIRVFHRISPNALVHRMMEAGVERHAISNQQAERDSVRNRSINALVTGRLGFLAGVRRRASRLADLEPAGSADKLPPSSRRDPTQMISMANDWLISTGLVPIRRNPAA